MISIIFSILALINSIYLTSLKLLQKNVCLVGSSCQNVINSDYGMLFGLPLSVYGILFFSVITYISFQRFYNKQESLGFELILLSLGSIFSLYLMIIQFFIIKSFCIFCSVSAGITLILWILCFLEYKRHNLSFSLQTLSPSRYILIGSGILFFILISLITYAKVITTNYDISFLTKHAAVSTIKNFSITELNNLAGVEYTKTRIQQQSILEQSFINYIARYDANLLGISLDQYYRAFVQKDLDVTNKAVRKTIIQTKSDPRLFEQYLSSVRDIDQSQFRNRYQQLQNTVLTRYDATFLLDKNFKTLLKNNNGSPQTGPYNAPLKIVIFSDFLCSHCARFHAELEYLINQHPNLFHVTYRNFPLRGQISDVLAKISICSAKQNQFQAFADAIYANQKDVTIDTINTYLPPDLNNNQLLECVQSRATSQVLFNDVSEVKRLNIQSTPAVFLNGYIANINIIKAELTKITGIPVQPAHNHNHHHGHGDHNH